MILFQNNKDRSHPVGNNMFKVNIRNTRRTFEIRSNVTIKTPERCQ